MSRSVLRSGEEVARSSMYRLLARLWLREVDRDLLVQLTSPPLCISFTEAGGVLPSDDEDAAIGQLEVDYCQLFVGPSNHLPPFQSVWKSGQLSGKPIDSMRQFIDICGYDIDKLPPGTMLDHLGLQLDVMAHIVAELDALPSHTDHWNDVSDLADSFFVTHLQWPVELLETAEKRATTDFYRSVALLTSDFLKSEVLD